MNIGKSAYKFYISCSCTLVRRMVFYTVITCSMTMSALLLLTPAVSEAGEHEPAITNSPASTPSAGGNETKASARAMAGLQANQAATGMVYAPRDVVDMTRLVLEVSRDQSAHTAHNMEIATKVILLLFTTIGAVGAAFGMHKIGDVEKYTDKLKEKFAADMEAKLTALHLELNDQSELLTAKAEMNMAAGDTFLLRNAADRIKVVLDKNNVSELPRIRGLADYAYVLKRTGEVNLALRSITEAIDLAKVHATQMIPLLSFNAACYYCILKNAPEAIRFLKSAIELNSRYKDAAAKDDDFKNIKDTEDFKNLLK